MAKFTPTKEELQHDFVYQNGQLINKRRRATNCEKGQIAGTKHHDGYIEMMWRKERYRRSHLVWLYHNGGLPAFQMDHINQKRDDDRIENLRPVSQTQNLRNKKNYKSNTSGYPGVCQVQSGRWIARIAVSGKKMNLGTFATKDAAIRARRDAEESLGFHPNHGR